MIVICSCSLRCRPCHMMGPIFADYSIKYSAAIFLKVDVDKCKVDKYTCCSVDIVYKNNIFILSLD